MRIKSKATPPSKRRGVGSHWETEACRWLEAKGWKIIARNIYFSCGELDIIARSGNAIVAVEVRSVCGGALVSAAASISRAKLLRLRRSLFRFLHNDPRGREAMPWLLEIRIDLLAYEPETGWQHFEAIRF